MLTLRNDQLEALNTAISRGFERRMVKHLCRLFPERCEEMGPDALGLLIREGVRKAAGYRVRAERDVALFIDLMMGLSPDFDNRWETDWTREILEDDTLSPSDRMDLIYSNLKHRNSEPAQPADFRGMEK